jgi:MFS transporter, PAT family, beta-lactamase induction signal transducer AmpG
VKTKDLTEKITYRKPWNWIPSLYFAEGLPYVMVMTVSGILYKRLGISNGEIALYTSWLYLPWTIKPLWSPFVDMFGTKRRWVFGMQSLIAVMFGGIAFALQLHSFFFFTLIVFAFMAFASATHDIAADGFYILGLNQADQSVYVGVRSVCFRIAMIAGQGGLVVLAGNLEPRWGRLAAWSLMFIAAAILFGCLSLFHRLFLPYPESDKPSLRKESGNFRKEFIRAFVLFFRRKDIGIVLSFLLLYRFAEAQLVKLVPLFLLDARERGGLGLSTTDVGMVYGTVGIAALVAGGLIGGYVISRQGLRWWLWPMVVLMHAPDLAFVYLSHALPTNLLFINLAVAVEQFGYGFGFTAYAMYMIYIASGEYATAHFAVCTGIMALGMMLPGMFSGKIQEILGYQNFFFWVILSTIPGFIVAALVKIPEGFGKKQTAVGPL